MRICKQRILCLTIMLVLILGGCSEQKLKIDDNRDSIATKDTIIGDATIEDTVIEEKTAVDEISSIFKESGYTVMCESQFGFVFPLECNE